MSIERNRTLEGRRMRRPSAGRPNADGQDHVVRRGEKSFARPRCRRIERSKGEGERLPRTGSGGEGSSGGSNGCVGATGRSPLLRRRAGLRGGDSPPRWPSRATCCSVPPSCLLCPPSTLRSIHTPGRKGERFFAPTQEGRAQRRRSPPRWPSRATCCSAPPPCLLCPPSTLRSIHAPSEDGRKIFRPYAGGPGSKAVLPYQRSGVHRIFHPHAAPPSVRARIIDVERNTAGDSLQEVLRLHDARLRIFPDLRFGSERNDGERLDVLALPSPSSSSVHCVARVETSKRTPIPPDPSPPPLRPFDKLRVLPPAPKFVELACVEPVETSKRTPRSPQPSSPPLRHDLWEGVRRLEGGVGAKNLSPFPPRAGPGITNTGCHRDPSAWLRRGDACVALRQEPHRNRHRPGL